MPLVLILVVTFIAIVVAVSSIISISAFMLPSDPVRISLADVPTAMQAVVMSPLSKDHRVMMSAPLSIPNNRVRPTGVMSLAARSNYGACPSPVMTSPLSCANARIPLALRVLRFRVIPRPPRIPLGPRRHAAAARSLAVIVVIRNRLVSAGHAAVLRPRRDVHVMVSGVMAMMLIVAIVIPILGECQAGRHCDQRDADPYEFSFHALIPVVELALARNLDGAGTRKAPLRG